jgi:hypothetical protein
MRSHEVDNGWGNRFRGANKIPLVFAIFIVHNNNHFAILDVFKGFIDGV